MNNTLEISEVYVVTPEVRLISAEKAQGIIDSKVHEDIAKLQNNIIFVDFSKIKSFSDPNLAAMCVVVCTSDGSFGTLSHLQTNADVKAWADELKKFHPSPTPVCIAGGISGISDELLKNITSELTDRDFIVPETDSDIDYGGSNNTTRRVCLFKNKLKITQNPYGHMRRNL
ncbi:hypothetical protein KKG52_00295, partial [Patescibacteria group bacterium]|nr:hypothetical protein [Patescibacteria group bacterium]